MNTTIEVLPLVLPPENRQEWPDRVDHKIVKAAIKFGDRVYVGWRHAYILDYLRNEGHERMSFGHQDDQGFINHLGWFFDRQMSAKIASGSRQCTWDQIKAMTLLSEDLWDGDGKPHPPGKPFDPMGDRKSRRFL